MLRLHKASSSVLRAFVSQQSLYRNSNLKFIQNQTVQYVVNRSNITSKSLAIASYDRNNNDSNDGSKNTSQWWLFDYYMKQYSLLSVWLLGLSGIYLLSIDYADNCGIIGVVGSDDAKVIVLEGLTILQNRGYDSAGIATVPDDGNELFVTKYASRESTSDSIDLVRKGSGKHTGHKTGIGHTRWATHGGKTDFNAHPHTDTKDRIALIHNGTINNSYDLKKELLSKGIKFKSETDTEVIAQLVGLNLDEGMSTKEALSRALGM